MLSCCHVIFPITTVRRYCSITALVSDHMGFPNRYVLASILSALLSIRLVPFYQLYLKLVQFCSEPQTYYSANSIVGILYIPYLVTIVAAFLFGQVAFPVIFTFLRWITMDFVFHVLLYAVDANLSPAGHIKYYFGK